MMKTLKQMKLSEREKLTIPKSVQDIIPIKGVYKDGIFLVGKNKYSKTFQFTDINFNIETEQTKEDLLKIYWTVLNSFSPGMTVKLTINNHKYDKAEFEKTILKQMKHDNIDYIREEYNQIMIDRIESSNCIVQDKYFTITVEKKNIEEAKAFFARVGNDLTTRLARLNSKCIPLDANRKLEILHNFYREGYEENYNLDFEQLQKCGVNIKDYICPDSVEFESDYMKINNKFCRTIFLRNYGTFIKDDMIKDLTSLNKNLMLSVDFIPIPLDESFKELDNVLLGIETDLGNYKRRQQENGNFTGTNFDLEQKAEACKDVKNDLLNRDQKMFETVITMVLTADTKQELESITDTIFSKAGESSSSQFAILRFQQLDGLNTVLPIGVRKINVYRSLTTESLSSFVPFNAQEVQHKKGVYYGQNAISNNMIFVDRKELMNGNCIALGVSGGGKSFFVKLDVVSNIITDDNADVIIIDPEREYGALVKALGGEVINISASSTNHINAMDMNKEYANDNNPVATKAQFIMSLCEQLVEEKIGAKEKSIIDRCCRIAYSKYIKSGYKCEPPTLQDFRDELLKQSEDEAKELALAIELFTDGSLNTFAKPTNVDTNNRLICYDILDLGSQLLPVGMLVVLDNILNRITANRNKGRTTYIYIDEIYLLFKEKYTADFLYTLWKRVRKYGAFATGITQNIGDMLQSNTARTMLANSEFVVMLNQNGRDRFDLAELLNITSNQMNFFTNVAPGHGLLKIGSNFIPYINEFPKNTELYKLMSTKPREKL